MRREIGSEFWDVPLTENKNKIFDNATWFVSGRAAFRSIIQQIKIENGGFKPLKVALPSYLCESMIEPVVKENVEYKFYSVSFKDGFLFLLLIFLSPFDIVVLFFWRPRVLSKAPVF